MQTSQTTTPFPTVLEIVKTTQTFANGFSVKSVDGNTVFSLERPFFSVHKRSILLDNAGDPVVTLRRKRMTAHNRWQVFRGKSDQIKDLMFTVKQSMANIFQPRTPLELEVFLANNTEEIVYEFKVEGNWSNGSCDIYSVQSGNIIAQMGKHAVQANGSENFIVKVEAHVDSSFIVSLIAILSLE